MYKYEHLGVSARTFNAIEKEKALSLYSSMLRIRRVQEKIADDYSKDEMKTPVHLCIGQEAIAAGVCGVLRKTDLVFSNHRGHGHYLAKGGDLKKMIAELFCKEAGCSKGRGGSMHLVDLAAGLPGSSSIVAGGVPLATGAAFSQKMFGDNSLTVVFLGDAASEEGVVYESLNFAALKKLPILYVCENNFYAVCSPLSSRSARDIYKIAEPFGIPASVVDGTDVEAVYRAARDAVDHIRKGNGPVFIEMKAYRWKGHSGGKEDFNLGYRTQEELENWKKACPVKKYEEKLEETDILSKEQINWLNNEIETEISNAFEFAKNSPLPKDEDIMKYVYQN